MKEVIFHFFPSARFLGLSLKILFHKNKEIERMLSKKMTFSLMSLITLLAFAFMAPSAMAEFGVTLTVDPDANISSEGVTHVLAGSPVKINVVFGAVVKLGDKTGFDASDIEAIAYNEFGGTEAAPDVGAPSDYDSNNPDGKNFTLTVATPGDGVTRVLLYMVKHGVELADPRAEVAADGTRNVAGKSAEASVTIHYVAADQGKPRVYSIRRVDTPALPVTADTVQVVIRLSEKPGAFTKDHISVTEATWGDPVALVPVPEDTLGFEALKASVAEAAAIPEVVVRGLYDTEDADNVAVPGIHSILNGITDNDLAGLETDEDGEVVPPVEVPDTKDVNGIDRSTEPTYPDRADFTGNAAYLDAVLLHTEQNRAYTAYKTEKDAHDAYMDAVVDLMAEDAVKVAKYNNDVIDALEAHFQGQTIPRENPLPATGRDNKLYPYVVTITPKYLNTNDIVVKVKAFEDQDYPAPNRYIPPATEAAYRENINKLTIQVKAAILPDRTGGIVVYIPENTIIPADGYLVVAKDAGWFSGSQSWWC